MTGNETASLDRVLPIGTITNGLLTGLYFAFACAVSPALQRLDDQSFVTAFRSINSAILNCWFLVVFFTAPLITVGCAVVAGVGWPGDWHNCRSTAARTGPYQSCRRPGG